jgi:tRNA wybutosine-synthesizing protein 1
MSRQTLVPTVLSLAATGFGLAWYLQKQHQPSKKEEREDTNNVINDKSETSALDVTTDAPIFEITTTAGTNNNDTNGSAAPPPDLDDRQHGRVLSPGSITIAHGSVTGTCAKLAQELYKTLKTTLPDRHIELGTLEEWDWWDELLNEEEEEQSSSSKKKKNKKDTDVLAPVLLILLPTHHGGSWPHTATCLESALQELKHDWRVSSHPLKKLQVAIMGMGCSDYGDDTMGKPAKQAFGYFRQLGAISLGRKVRVGDDSTGNQDRVLQAWIHHDILPTLVGGDDEDEEEDQEDQEKEPTVMDMEDMGSSMDKKDGDGEDDDEVGINSKEPREMVTSTQAKALKKEGYKLIGTHSAVKLCRWTKHQLRGRGGCYKHTFYGITSYQCMEATPSLACANKCVFCWRHHKNPVAKEWKWKTDDPHFIVEEAVKQHIQMIKETKGIPGVNMERWKEAHTVRHCALSLVGEPIMYPRIDDLLGDLHSRKISTFLVTNGQHPQAISSIRPITQLYVSVDAPTPESLIAVDRPLFSDAWERLQQSLELLKDKGQRTVARLTIVKGWNTDEIQGYAKLIALGKVSLIEVKGVTFCGKSDASNLNMSNTPWHHECVELVKNLKHELDKLREEGGPDAPPEYDIACEHRHSVSVLLARVDQFTDTAEDGSRRWRTWIDYHKFHELAMKNAADPSFTFSVQEYTQVTPAWALFGSEEEGFDPIDLRHRKAQKHPMYTQFDSRGVPTHDHVKELIGAKERSRLMAVMDQKLKEVGAGTTVTELKGGEKLIGDASLMFRGLIVTH